MQEQKKTTTDDKSQEGATALITHFVREGQEENYSNWLKEIDTACRRQPGYLDMHVIRPVQGLTNTHSIMLRFDTQKNLDRWMGSDVCQSLIKQVQDILTRDEEIYIKSGLDFWFTPKGAQAQLPKRWKQFLATWSAIFPITLILELIANPLLPVIGIPDNVYLNTLIVTCFSVLAMVYVVMPPYTRLIQRWLFDRGKKPTS